MVDVNRNNNDTAVRRAELQRQLDSLPPTASDQERQALQTRLDALGSSRDVINNNQTVKSQDPGNGNDDIADAKAALQAALGVDQASVGTPASPETRIPEEYQKLGFLTQAIDAGEKALLKNTNSVGTAVINTLISSAKQLFGYTVKFIEGLMEAAKSNKKLMEQGSKIVKPDG